MNNEEDNFDQLNYIPSHHSTDFLDSPSADAGATLMQGGVGVADEFLIPSDSTPGVAKHGQTAESFVGEGSPGSGNHSGHTTTTSVGSASIYRNEQGGRVSATDSEFLSVSSFLPFLLSFFFGSIFGFSSDSSLVALHWHSSKHVY